MTPRVSLTGYLSHISTNSVTFLAPQGKLNASISTYYQKDRQTPSQVIQFPSSLHNAINHAQGYSETLKKTPLSVTASSR